MMRIVEAIEDPALQVRIPKLAPRTAVTRAFEASLRQQWRRCCKGHKYDCPVYGCPKATTRAVARCKAERCVREVLGLKR